MPAMLFTTSHTTILLTTLQPRMTPKCSLPVCKVCVCMACYLSTQIGSLPMMQVGLHVIRHAALKHMAPVFTSSDCYLPKLHWRQHFIQPLNGNHVLCLRPQCCVCSKASDGRPLTSRCMQASTKTKIRGPPMSNSSRFRLRVLLLAIQVDRCKMPVMSMPSSAEWER